MSRVSLDAFEDGAEVANDGDVFVRNKAHANGGTWQALGGSGPAFPVGSVFISVVPTDPATLLGYGTWAAFGAGRVLVGLDATDTDFDTVEETGGAKTKAISAHSGTAVGNHASHTHGAGTLTTDTVLAHTHGAGTLLPSAHAGTAVSSHDPHSHSINAGPPAVTISDHAAHTHGYGTIAVADHAAHTHGYGTIAVADHAAHTHAGGTYAVADHTHSVGTLSVSAHGSVNRGTGSSATAATTGHTLSGATGTYPGGAPSLSGSSGNPSATLTHSVSGSTGNPSATLTHSVSGSTGNPSATLTHSISGTTDELFLNNHVVTQPNAHTMSGSTGSDGSHFHAVTLGNTSNESATLTHSVTQPDAHADLNVVQPYIVCYFWKRTA